MAFLLQSGPSVGTVTILSMGNYNNKNQDIFFTGLQDEQVDITYKDIMEYRELTEKIIGCAYRVYNNMGFGFL